MELLVQTEYQDVYRIKKGVRLIVNKFKKIIDENGNSDFISIYSKNNPYHNEGRDLRVLTADHYYAPKNKIYKSGQVIFDGSPVELVEDKNEWSYQIKTTGDSFSGKLEDIKLLLEEILGKVCEAHDLYNNENSN